MASVDEIRYLISESRSRIEQDRAALLRMMQELARTRVVIERATLAYIASLGTLKKLEGTDSNSPPNTMASLYADGESRDRRVND